MNDVSQGVSLADGTLNPDMRVNYEFGLVLGVNEFRQEQDYFLEKDYLYNRELHGYGIVSGLDVSTGKVGEDEQISVKPGMAIDKWGRSIVVRDTQCARLAAWLAKWEQDNATSSPPVKVGDKLDKDGNGKLYVVISHDERLDMLVPVAGQLCGSSDTMQEQSRIRDFYNLELRWDAPQMPAWDAVRCFARLMSLVRIVPELPLYLSDEDKIIEQVHKLDQPCPLDGFAAATDPNTGVFRLPATLAREALDRIFAVWTTGVRPNLRPDLLTTGADSSTSDAAILLAQLDFTVTISDGTSPRFTINYCQANKNLDGKRPLPRPFVLHSQLMQELLLLSQEQKPEREFATLEVLNAHRLRIWLHHTPEQLVVPSENTKDWSQYFQLRSDDAPITINGMAPVDNAKNVFDLTTVDRLVPGARVELTFRLDKLALQSGRTLQESIDTLIYDYIGHDRITNTITTGFIASPILPALELVTFSTIAPTAQEPPHLSLWFHTPAGPVRLPATIVGQRFVQGVAQPITFSTAASAVSEASPGFSSFWELKLTGDVAPLAHKEALSLAFNTDEIHVGTDAQTLTNDIQDAPHSFVGYDGAHTLYAFYEVDNPPSEREFATLEAQDSHTLRAWIHTRETLAMPTGDKVDWSQYFQLKSDNGAINISKMAAIENTQNVFDLTTDALLLPGARIELTFLLDKLTVVGGKTLQEDINTPDYGYDYVGYDPGTGTITIYIIVERLLPLREFATLEVLNAHNLRFWLHHPEPLTLDTHRQALPLDEQFMLKSEGQTLSIANISVLQPNTNNSFILTTNPEQPLVPGARIELTILLDGLATDDDKRIPLQERINALGIEYASHDATARTITAYTTAERLQTLELVTFNTVLPTDQDPAPHLLLWFHTPVGPIKLPAQITGQRLAQGGSQNITFNASTNDSSGFSYSWELRPQDSTLSHKDLLSFALDTGEIHVSTDQRTLTFEMQETQQFYRGYDGDHTLYAFYEVDSPPRPQPLPPPGPSLSDILNLPAQPFVTITALPVANSTPNFELWFHLDLDPASNVTFIQGNPVVKVFAEQGGNNDQAPSVDCTITGNPQRNVFTASLDAKAGPSSYLRFVFPVGDQMVQTAPDKTNSLKEYSTEKRVKFEGFNGNDAIIAYVRVPSA